MAKTAHVQHHSSQKGSGPHANPDVEAQNAVRLDIWLFRTRLLKSRGLASRFIQNGKLHLTRHGQTLRPRKPHTLVRPGDVMTFMRGDHLYHIRMLSPGSRRGPAREARQLYEIVTPDTQNKDRDNPSSL